MSESPVPLGEGPLVWRQQEALREALIHGPAAAAAPVKTTIMNSTTPEPAIPATKSGTDIRSYPAELRYNPGNKPGIVVKFRIRTFSEDELNVTILHNKDFSMAFTGLTENLELRVGSDKKWIVTYLGGGFSLPDENVYGITFLKCPPPNQTG